MSTTHATLRTTLAPALIPCAQCKRLHPMAALQRSRATGRWICRDRDACWFATRDNARIAAALRAETPQEAA